MQDVLHILQVIGFGFGYLFVALLCLLAVALSCVSITGGWVVSLATIIAVALGKTPFPTWYTVVAFLLISAAIEGVEFMAGTWGVTKRGGSGWAGVAALVGTIVGAMVGVVIPIPLIGSVLGMMVFGFVFVFCTEYHFVKKEKKDAAHIAWGSVVARIFVIFLKVTVTVSMILYLTVGAITSL